MKHELIIREPELYFDSIHNELNNLLRDTFFAHSIADPFNIKKISTWRPAIEVRQCDKGYKVKVQLPGVKKDDIEVELDNDFLTVTAEIHEEKEEKEEEENARYHTSEFRYGKYKRTISFDRPILADEATAKYKNGVLMIKIPAREEKTAEAKKLAIQDE